jgi:signal transduction histidine kinase
LERRIADHTQKLSALYDVITATAEAPDLRSTLNWSLQRVLEAIQCSAGMIQLIDDFDIQTEPKALRLVAQKGLPDEAVQVLAETAVNSTLFGLAMFSGHPIVIPNLATHPIAPAVIRQQRNLQTYVGTAMVVRERTVGILSVFAENGRYFGEIELALLDSVADQIGIVVENSYLHKQAEETAVAEERHRLARELHDSVTQAIYSLTLFTEAGLRLIRSGSYDRIEELLNHLNDTSQQALREMRLMLHKLRPPDLEEEGLVGALQQRLDEVETRANVEVNLIVEGNLDDLPEAVEEQLYRIAQEALNNALKHSAASLLTVRISADDDDITLEISDDGKGFDVDAAQDAGGMGLQNMEERTEELDGEWTIESTVGEGTTISVQIDLDTLELDEEEALF